MKNTGASSIMCFTILVLPVLLGEEYWSFQYRVFYNTSITSIVGWRILELTVLCIDQRFWYSSIVNARYWYIQYCIYTILDFRYCNITILVFLVLYSVITSIVIQMYSQYWYFQYCKYYNTSNTSIVNITILVIPVSRPAASYYPIFYINLQSWKIWCQTFVFLCHFLCIFFQTSFPGRHYEWYEFQSSNFYNYCEI
jgi:hypothetical protein